MSVKHLQEVFSVQQSLLVLQNSSSGSSICDNTEIFGDGLCGQAASSSKNYLSGNPCRNPELFGDELSCGHTASSSQNYPVQGRSYLGTITAEDVPGASLNGHSPSQLHVVELKRWLKCRGATTAGEKQDLVKRLNLPLL